MGPPEVWARRFSSLADWQGLKLFGTGSGAQTGVISALATPIDYTKGNFATRIRELTGDGADVVLDGIGGRVALRFYRALCRGRRLVLFGHYSTLVWGPEVNAPDGRIL
jgi:NADPH2:quinone reductase